MKSADFHRRAELIKDRLQAYLRGRVEIGLTDVTRDLSNHFAGEPLASDGRFVAKMLNAVGWQRSGWLYTGYDRTPRYAPIGGEARS